ncbi:MAG: MFS transporter [Chlamydiota bacterium]
MRRVWRNVVSPLVSLVIVMVGSGFFNTYTSLRIAIDGYPSWVIGVLNASYYLGLMLGSLYIKRLIERIGHIRTFAIFASINSGVILVQAVFISPVSWTFLRLLNGFCSSGFFIVIESWLLLSTGVKHRGRLLSLYMLTLYLAQGFGQFLLNVSPLRSLLPFAMTVFLSSLSVIPVCMMKSSGPLLFESSMTNILHILKKAPLGLIGCFVAGIIMSSFYGLAPIFAKDIGLSVIHISQVMGLTILGGLTLQWPIGHLSDVFNRRKVIIFVVVCLMVLTFVLFYSQQFSYSLLLGLMIVFGGISFTFYPLSITLTCDSFAERNIISVTCSLLVVYGTGCIVGPLASSAIMESIGSSGLFLLMSVLCAIFIVLGMWRVVHCKPFSEEEQSDYLPVPRATSLAFYLDPHTEIEDEELDESDELYPFSEEYDDGDDEDE